jgi:hypothetical protein
MERSIIPQESRKLKKTIEPTEPIEELIEEPIELLETMEQDVSGSVSIPQADEYDFSLEIIENEIKKLEENIEIMDQYASDSVLVPEVEQHDRPLEAVKKENKQLEENIETMEQSASDSVLVPKVEQHNRSSGFVKKENKKLDALYSRAKPGLPLFSEDLAAVGISRSLVSYYVRLGWLTRVAAGVYCLANDTLSLNKNLMTLQHSFKDLYVGGKSALDWYGLWPNVEQQPMLHLYNITQIQLPGWFLNCFATRLHINDLFDERRDNLFYVSPFKKQAQELLMSEPERAFLELLSDSQEFPSLEKNPELIEPLNSLRVEVMQDLLSRCVCVRTIHACLDFGKKASLLWATKINAATCLMQCLENYYPHVLTRESSNIS